MRNVRGVFHCFKTKHRLFFFKGCARGAREGERTEEPAAKALVFRFLRSLAVRRMILAACLLFSRGLIFTRARVSLALLSLRKNGGLLVV